jgi:hypothetical protein
MALKIDLIDLPAPLLQFGGSGEFTDPKAGLLAEGPFSLRFGAAHKGQVRLGMVGPPEVLARARAWFEHCQDAMPSGKENQVMYPDFPGFQGAFRASLDLQARWRVELDGRELEKALKGKPPERFRTVLDLYVRAVERLADADVKPDVTVCCLPKEVVKECHSINNPRSTAPERKRAQKLRQERDAGQISLFEDWEVEENEEDLLHRDFRRALKARVMGQRMPIQIGTDNLFLDSEGGQDPATRAWNSCLALFYKAGGIPWRLKSEGPDTCFVGVSFHHLRTERRHLVYSSLAQAFPSEGDGFALRGDAVPWDADQGRNPHLSEDQAAGLAEEVLGEYRQRTGRDPARVVLHKTSKFDPAERGGFREALNRVPVVEIVNLMPTRFRLVRDGSYPPNRGTLCTINSKEAYLFTTGYMPEWETYPGPHVPVPRRLVVDEDANVQAVAADVLGLTRMNWNTARDTSGLPITMRFAREVGGIMAEVGPNERPNPSYRYYM